MTRRCVTDSASTLALGRGIGLRKDRTIVDPYSRLLVTLSSPGLKQASSAPAKSANVNLRGFEAGEPGMFPVAATVFDLPARPRGEGVAADFFGREERTVDFCVPDSITCTPLDAPFPCPRDRDCRLHCVRPPLLLLARPSV